MAGAFTHFVVCDVAKRKRSTIGSELWRLLNKHSQFLSLGAASPDLPYLSFKTGEVNWADVMHYEKTNSIVENGLKELKSTWYAKTTADDIKLVWLLGYASHLVADATIHPVVQAIVGPYEQNKEEHRLCEMTQDSLIFNLQKKTDIYYAEFSEILKFCKESEHFDGLIEFWKHQVLYNYQDKGEEPHPALWFSTYTEAIDAAEGGGNIVGLFRHLGIGSGYIYKPKDEILANYPEYHEKYFLKVRLPDGSIGYFPKDGFDKTVNNVTEAWGSLYQGLSLAQFAASSFVKNWNLDTGVDMDSPRHEVSYWSIV
jgi:hypothetical protein